MMYIAIQSFWFSQNFYIDERGNETILYSLGSFFRKLQALRSILILGYSKSRVDWHYEEKSKKYTWIKAKSRPKVAQNEWKKWHFRKYIRSVAGRKVGFGKSARVLMCDEQCPFMCLYENGAGYFRHQNEYGPQELLGLRGGGYIQAENRKSTLWEKKFDIFGTLRETFP